MFLSLEDTGGRQGGGGAYGRGSLLINMMRLVISASPCSLYSLYQPVNPFLPGCLATSWVTGEKKLGDGIVSHFIEN